jgi:LPXTG-site transpeptidase (sortase) family protein
MQFRVSRRRAVAHGSALFAALTLSLAGLTRSTAAQVFDPPGDVPWPAQPVVATPVPVVPEPAPVVAVPTAVVAEPVQVVTGSPDLGPPLGQAGGDSQPADEPIPDVAPAAPGPWGVPPVKIAIPALGIEAPVEPVGQDADGAMSAPTHPDEVAWYKLGPGMGVPGNVVLAGHINWEGRVRTFGYLDQLGPGDVVQVIDEQGRGFEYAVDSSRWVRAEGAPLEEIFAQPTEPVLTLITCGGEYVASRREYLDRLIVRAKGAPTKLATPG